MRTKHAQIVAVQSDSRMPSKIIRTLLAGTNAAECGWMRRCLKPSRARGKAGGTQWQLKGPATFSAAIKYLGREKCDLIAMGLHSSGYNLAARLKRLRKIAPETPVIAFADHEDRGILNTACALLDLNTAQQARVAAIVLPGKSRTEGRDIEELTPRENQILRLIANALSTKEVANHLKVSAKTVETHRSNLMRKLQIHSVGQLVHYAVRHGLVEV